MIEKVASGVREAMARAGITDPADVHYVQTKAPLLTIETIRDAKSRGPSVWTEQTHESMDLSNGTTALGIGVTLGEFPLPADADVLHNLDVYSAVSSCSSGVELDRVQTVVVGNARGVGGRFRIGHAVMRDALDADGIWAAIRDAGLALPDRPRPSDLDDADVRWRRQIKARVGGVAASVTGDPVGAIVDLGL
jgi:cyanuric acid amidohydrolase